MSNSVQPHRLQPTRLPRPWDSPGKNTGVGCHFLLQCMKMKSFSHVRLLVTPWTAAYQAPLSIGFSRQEYWSGGPLPSPERAVRIPHFPTATSSSLKNARQALSCLPALGHALLPLGSHPPNTQFLSLLAGAQTSGHCLGLPTPTSPLKWSQVAVSFLWPFPPYSVNKLLSPLLYKLFEVFITCHKCELLSSVNSPLNNLFCHLTSYLRPVIPVF